MELTPMDRIVTLSCNRRQSAPAPFSPRAMAQDDDRDISVITRPKPKTKSKRPSMYKVIILNDDFTPMEFVVHVLERVFNLNRDKAFEIMLTVHMKGSAVVGVFTFEVAETKVSAVMEIARRNEHPLQCRMEKD